MIHWRSAAIVLLLARMPAKVEAQEVSNDRLWWIAAGAALTGTLLLDDEFRDLLPEGGGTRLEPLADALNPLGNPRYLIPAIAASWAVGRIATEPELATSSIHVLGALLAGGVANGSVKSVVGRERPVGGDPWSFRPFNLENRWQSFPSGHVIVAFSVADAISQEADRRWVSVLTYGTASAVAWSRVYEDKHWSSDVVGGAILGVVSSRAALALAHRLNPHSPGSSSATIAIYPGGWVASIPTD